MKEHSLRKAASYNDNKRLQPDNMQFILIKNAEIPVCSHYPQWNSHNAKKKQLCSEVCSDKTQWEFFSIKYVGIHNTSVHW